MRIVLFLSLIPAFSGVAVAQDAPSKAAASADKFSIDIPADDTATMPAEASPADAVAPPAPVSPVDGATVPAPATPVTFSLDTPIAELIADYRAKAVLDRDLPGLSTDENLDKFKALTLRRFAPLTGGQLSPDLLSRTAYDLAAITAGVAPMLARSSSRKSTGR